jgi:hypothetical protein
LGIFLEQHQPHVTLSALDMTEGEASTLTLTLDQAVGENGEVYALRVSDPDFLTLSGEGVVLLDADAGKYQVSVAAGATALSVQANAVASDGNNIVNAVTLSVLGVTDAQEADGAPGRILDTLNLVIDDTHYDPSGAQHHYGTNDEDREVGADAVEGVLTYSYGLGGDDRVLNSGGLTRNDAGDDNDTVYSRYVLSPTPVDRYDGSTVEEIAAYLLEKDYVDDAQTAMARITWE